MSLRGKTANFISGPFPSSAFGSVRRGFQLSPQTWIKTLVCANPELGIGRNKTIWKDKQAHGIIIKMPCAEKHNRYLQSV